MTRFLKIGIAVAMSLLFVVSGIIPWLSTKPALADTKSNPPNILVIMGDDIGWTNISAYEKGIVGYETPNIDRIAKEGMLFTDYYGEQSCTAGRAAFITGQSGLRTGLLRVGFPGADFGIQKEDPTLAEMLKPLRYVTGQFGKNHLGDKNEFLPTVHGFDKFFGNLYHLNAEEEPENVDYPKGGAEEEPENVDDPEEEPENVDDPPSGYKSNFAKIFGPRGVLDCEATKDSQKASQDSQEKDDTLLEKLRFKKWGNQKCKNTGPLTSKRMETFDDEVLKHTKDFIEKAVTEQKAPFFAWFNSSRMHFYTHIKDEVKGKSGQGFYNDGMVEHDGHVGELLDLLDKLKIADNTIVIYTTDNGPHYNQWPDGGLSPFRGEKNTNWEGGYRVPALVRWPGHIPAGTVSHEIFSHLDWVPTLMAAAGQGKPEYNEYNKTLLKTCPTDEETNLCGTYLDGYNQLSYLTDPKWKDEGKTDESGKRIGKPKGERKQFIYFNDDAKVVGIRMNDWKIVFAEQLSHGFDVWRDPFVKLRIPKIFNLRRDPYERADTDSNNYDEWWSRRAYLLLPAFTAVQQFLGTFEKYPPSQRPFEVNLDNIVKDIINKVPQTEPPFKVYLDKLREHIINRFRPNPEIQPVPINDETEIQPEAIN